MEKPIILSPLQQACCDFVTHGTGSAIVEAVAGSGKTTTALRMVAMMRGSVYVGMYNKKIAVEVKEKADKLGMDMHRKFIGTFHSAGYSAWRRYLGDKANELEVDDQKTRKICENNGIQEDLHTFICKMVSFGKQLLVPANTESFANRSNAVRWAEISEHFGADNELPENVDMDDVWKVLDRVYSYSHKICHKVVDFDDMIYAPVAHNVRTIFQNDWVVVDEGQDTNPARRELARRMLKRNGRLIALGDMHQSIYGFSGADSNALDLIKREFKAISLPLNVSYRCPRKVVEYAQQFVNHIEAAPDAPEGHVSGIPAMTLVNGITTPWYTTNTPLKTDAVLCRYTRPLVQTAYGMLQNGIACRVEGRDIGKNLIALVTRWKVKTLDALEDKLDAYYAREAAKAKEKRRDAIRQSAEDRVGTVKIFINRCRAAGNHTVSCVVKSIEELFADNVTGVTVLSTIHKAKGREWGTVYWIQTPDPMRDLKDWEADGEKCCKYVAATRAQQNLILVQGM